MGIRLIISGGGTGGHIFPAIAIAHAIRSAAPDAEILFVGANGKMEMEKVPQAGYPIVGLNIAGIERSFSLKNLMFPVKLMGSLWQSFSIIRSHRPQVVVGVGGFASGPIMLAAQIRGIPTLIQEQNSHAGITNRWLGRRAGRICVAYSGMGRYFPEERILITGNPVRKDILDLAGKREEAQRFFSLDPSKKTLLIIGGSLGARSVNKAVEAGLPAFEKAGIQLIWQTGKSYSSSVSRDFAHPFITRMDLAYEAADVVLSRAGASSISELCIAGKASILVPFPFAAEDHQTSNARAMVEAGAAQLVADNEASATLVDAALALLADPARCAQMAAQARSLARTDADAVIASEVLKLARG